MTESKSTSKTTKKRNPSNISKIWGPENIKAGYTVIPNALILNMGKLKLGAVEQTLLLILIQHWWEPENLPFPSVKRLATISGRDVTTVRRNLKKLRIKKLIGIKNRNGDDGKGGQLTNEYDLRPLIEKIKPYSKEMIKKKKTRADKRGHQTKQS